MFRFVSVLSLCAVAFGLQQHDKPSLITEETGSVSLRRNLAVGDFEAFNSLIRESIIRLPDAVVNEQVAFIDLDLNLSNIRCTGLEVGDIVINHSMESSKRFAYEVDIADLDLTCFIDYVYKYGVLNGAGSVEAYTSRNSASTRLSFSSDNFDLHPPVGSSVEFCVADVEIDNLEFSGDFVSKILDVFERLIRNRLEREIGEVACEELGSLGTTLVSDMLDLAKAQLEPYLEEVPAAVKDPLNAEANLVAPEGVKLINVVDDESSTVSKWFNQALQEADALLGTEADDTEIGGRDLGVNVLLRSYALDEDRALTLELVDLPFQTDGILFEGHDKLTETLITFDRVRIFGLDSFSKFDPIVSIGKHTVQADLSWEYLTLEIDATVDMKPSTLPDAIIEEPKDTHVVENIKIKFGVKNMDAVVSFLLALDEDTVGALELGSLFDSSKIMPCLRPALIDTQFTGLNVKVGDVEEPVLDDFVSEGIDRIVTHSVEAAFAMYKPVVLRSIPSLFQTTLRDILNQHIVESFMNIFDRECPAIQHDNGFVDFRNLLLRPDEAELFGGTSDAPYGDMPPNLFRLINNQYFSVHEDGSLNINDLLVRPITESWSGEAGTLNFPSSGFSVTSNPGADSWLQSSVQHFELSIANARLKNLDTIMPPASALQATFAPQVLSNLIHIGTPESPLNATFSLLVAVDDGEDSPLTMHNEIELSASIPQASINANLLAAIRESRLLHFPLRDLLNFNCWLATIPAPSSVDSNITLAITEFISALSNLDIGMDCLSCSSPGLSVLPEVLRSLEDSGVSDVLRIRLEDLATDLIGSEYLQAVVDGKLIGAAQRCPHSPEYTDTPDSRIDRDPAFPDFSHDSLETIMFGATEVLKVGAVVAAESHSGYSAGMADPLSGQKELEVSSAVRLIDFTALGSLAGEWAETAIHSLNEYLSSTVNVASNQQLGGGTDLKVNSLIRSLFLDDESVLTVTFEDVVGLDAQVSLKKLNVVGLDSISTLNALDVAGPQTLRNVVGWRRLSLEVILAIDSADEDASRRSLKTSHEITVAVELKDVEASLAMLLALDVDLLGSLQLRSILEIRNILPCILSAAHSASVTESTITVGSIHALSVTGFKSDQLSEASAESSRALLNEYGDRLVSSIPALFDVTIRKLANNAIGNYMNRPSNVACPLMSVESSSANFIDLRDLLLSESMSRDFGGSGTSKYGDFFRTALGFLYDMVFQVDPTDGLSGLNDVVVGPMTRAQSNVTGTVEFPIDLFDQSTRVQVGGLDARVQLRAFGARMENLDTVGAPLSLMYPVTNEPYHLNNTATLGSGERPLRFALRFLLALTGSNDVNLRNDLDISLDMHSARAIVQALIKIAESRFYSFPLRDVLNLNCWLAAMPAPSLDTRGVRMGGSQSSLALTNLVLSVAELKPNVKCVSCTSPGMRELAELVSAPEAIEDITEIANKMLDYITQLMGGTFLQLQLDRLLNEAARKCPHSPLYEVDPHPPEYEPLVGDPEDPSIAYLVTIGLVVLALISSIAILVAVIRCGVQRRHRNWVNTLPNQQTVLVLRQQEREMSLEAGLNSGTQSMFRSPDVPVLARWLMPFVILGNIAFFLSGHLRLGATVDIEGEFAGEKIRFERFFEFSMAQSGIDIWKAGGRGLALLLLVFSGIWPYTKQLMSLALWFLPPSILPVSKRGSILVWLDWLAKWSMVDVFVLVVTIAAFRVSILSPDLQFLPEDFYNINLMVVPMWGLYANMTAQLISQLSSHFIIHYHRRIVDRATNAYKQANNLLDDAETVCVDEDQLFAAPNENGAVSAREGEQERLCKHAFLRPHRGESDKLVIHRGVNPLLVAISVLLVTCIIVGCSVPSFSLDVLGIVGVAVEAGQGVDNARTKQNVFTMLSLLIEEARLLDYSGGYIGLGTLSGLVILSVLIVPILQAMALLRQWLFSSTRKTRARLSIVIEILQAWQYTEVYLLSIFVASWQLGPISEFMINAYCGSLKETFAELVYYGLLKSTDAQCFRVDSRIEYGSYILLAGAVLLALLNTFVMKAVTQYFRDKQEEDRLLEEGISKHDDVTLYSVDDAFRRRIKPVPVLFTDTFRWMLRREDGVEGTRGWVLRQEEDSASGRSGSHLANNMSSIRSGAMSMRGSKGGSSRGSNSIRDGGSFHAPGFMPSKMNTSSDNGSHASGTMAMTREEESLCYSASVRDTAPDVDLNACMPPPDDDYDYLTVEDSMGEIEDDRSKEGFADEYDTVEGTLDGSRLFGEELQAVEEASTVYERQSLSGSASSSGRSAEDDETRKLADAIHKIYGKKGDSIDER